ncbi:hypothetical protein P256_02310 [Acinetobacter nectaris CIP 110549]|uniref:SGNH hydrolase-type esterase domain-containing protein n=1 Tax=Acinetobacter nectaris CIP 110549 TaxID=1392540 RepID=V2TN50_9GAMM|nr:SGNH/GDSL hydrolase family protein [Acinetobacter nectaris]ESK37255.1 hypothetical protein P256_02310 [Acinetobacter nectaris CIP 110549]
MNKKVQYIVTLLFMITTIQAHSSDKYVSLGSSYAAGPGVGEPDLESGKCARSLSNYAHQIAAHRHLDLVDVSCSGATTDNILYHGQHGFPPQIESLDMNTKLVSVLIGGNDVSYIGNLLGLSCLSTGGTHCHVSQLDNVKRRLAKLPSQLDQVIAEIHRRSPSAKIILIGYLPVIPTQANVSCKQLPMSENDVNWMRSVAIDLAQVIGAAAKRNNTGIVRSSLIGSQHDVCSSEPFVTGYYPEKNSNWKFTVSYHPTLIGMNNIATALDSEIEKQKK